MGRGWASGDAPPRPLLISTARADARMIASPSPWFLRRLGRLQAAVLFTFVLGVLAGVTGVPTIDARPLVLHSVSAEPDKILATGGRTTITIRATDVDPAGEAVRIATTLGAFGTSGGPTRAVLSVRPSAAGEAVVRTSLVGTGARGAATVTVSAGAIERSITVVFTGPAVNFSVQPPGGGSVLSAAVSHGFSVQARDRDGVTVPRSAVTFETMTGSLSGAGQAGATITVLTDSNGRARARIQAPPGPVRIEARAGIAAVELSFLLHGPPETLRLVSHRSAINLGNVPFGAPPGSLSVTVQDAGGRPVPGVPIILKVDPPDTIVQVDDLAGSLTDALGSLRAHLSAATTVDPGLVTVSARAGPLSASVTVRIVGPPNRVLLRLTPLGLGDYTVGALVQDASGSGVPTGFELDWEVSSLPPGADPIFEPSRSLIRNGDAETTLRLGGVSPTGVVVRATLVGSDPPIRGVVVVPRPLPQVGTLLNTGLNHLIWTGRTGVIGTVVDPIQRVGPPPHCSPEPEFLHRTGR